MVSTESYTHARYESWPYGMRVCGSGFDPNRRTWIFRSTCSGVTWSIDSTFYIRPRRIQACQGLVLLSCAVCFWYYIIVLVQLQLLCRNCQVSCLTVCYTSLMCVYHRVSKLTTRLMPMASVQYLIYICLNVWNGGGSIISSPMIRLLNHCSIIQITIYAQMSCAMWNWWCGRMPHHMSHHKIRFPIQHSMKCIVHMQ